MDQSSAKPWNNSQKTFIPKNKLNHSDVHISNTLSVTADNDTILEKTFNHKTFEERMAEYNNRVTICDYDWGDPTGKELI